MNTNTAVELESLPHATYLTVGAILAGVAVIVAITLMLLDRVTLFDGVLYFFIMGLVICTILLVVAKFHLHNTYDTNLELIESHYNVSITSGDTDFSSFNKKNKNAIKEYEVSFTNSSSGEFDKIDGEVRIKDYKAVLFYAPDSPDEMIPYEAE